jgi:hypothetical protein
MKITPPISPVQSFQTQTAGAGQSAAPHDAADALRLGSPKGLHPSNPSVDVAHEVLSKFRDPAALTAHSDHRRDGLTNLKNQIAGQFGTEVANAIFNQPNANAGRSSFGEDPPHSFRPEF